MGGISETTAREALRLASYKLPIKTKVIVREQETANQTEGGEE